LTERPACPEAGGVAKPEGRDDEDDDEDSFPAGHGNLLGGWSRAKIFTGSSCFPGFSFEAGAGKEA
jgi:hypothetical protein